MYNVYDWIAIKGYSKHKLATKKHVVLPDKIREISYHTPTSSSRPLSSVPKVAVVERFDCMIS